jgi:phosphotransferase system  glucose/maltose/N-acetylglucosamine-specific IIC component
VPANPTVMLIVNSLIAAVFWVFIGELLSRLIRFLAARVK